MTTSPELAVLGMNRSSELKRLRDSMIGTSTIANTPKKPDTLGATTQVLLGKIERHPSRAARSYYLKTYMQYFNGLQLSIAEISRVLKKGRKSRSCRAGFLDFKEVRVDLAEVVTEMGCKADIWPISMGKVDFPARRTMCGVHKHARKYRESVGATESVVFLSKN